MQLFGSESKSQKAPDSDDRLLLDTPRGANLPSKLVGFQIWPCGTPLKTGGGCGDWTVRDALRRTSWEATSPEKTAAAQTSSPLALREERPGVRVAAGPIERLDHP